MAYQTIDHEPLRPQSPRRASRSLLEITLLAGFVFCLAIGLLALLLFFWTRPTAHAIDAEAPAAQALQPDKISVPLSLMQLAGDPADAIAAQALNAGHIDTAFAAAVYAVELPTTIRRTLLLQAGRQFAEAGRAAEAEISLHAARALTILSPDFNPIDRHQTLLTIARAFLAIDALEAAQDTLAQALYSAAQTPGLLPAQRADVFEAVRPLAHDASDRVLAAQASEYARNPFLSPEGHLLHVQLHEWVEFSPPDPAVAQAVEERQFAARILAERIQLTGGIDIEPEQQALAVALQQEDAVRADAYRRMQAMEGLTSGVQLGFLIERRNWLALKARIAHTGFGISLVPEWEENAGFILQDLSTAHNNIHMFVENHWVEALGNEVADPQAQQALRMEILLQLAHHWELGLHPDGLGADLGERMRTVQDELARVGLPQALLLEYLPDARPPGFRMRGH